MFALLPPPPSSLPSYFFPLAGGGAGEQDWGQGLKEYRNSGMPNRRLGEHNKRDYYKPNYV